MAAGASVSALTRLLVAATSGGDRDAVPAGRDAQSPRDHRETHSSFREAARGGAERKARVLSRHRPALVRWAVAATSDIPRRRQHRQHSKRGNSGGATYASSAAVGDDESPPTAAVAGQTGELRTNNSSGFVSPLLSLVSTERLGRHLVAAEAIPPGTSLLRETPLAWCLHPAFSGDFCAHCLDEIAGSAVLCPKCGLVEYCSEACATAALRTWHGSECLDPSSGASLEPVMSALSPSCRVALRALRRARQQEQHGTLPSKCQRKDEELGKQPSAGTTTVAADGSSIAASVPASRRDGCGEWPAVQLGHLQEHYTARSARESELLETEAAVAAVLACGGGGGTAPRADAMGGGGGTASRADSDGSGRSAEDAKAAGPEVCELLAAELATTLFKVSTNAFSVSSLRCSEPSAGRRVRPMTHAKVAVGIFLAAAMFNHSCNPNALVTFRGGEMRVVATRAIEAGEPVTISYGPLASKVSSTAERQEYLRQAYFFLCECTACRPLTARTAVERSPLQRNGRDRGGDPESKSPKRTEFSCGKSVESGRCTGSLLLGVPLPSSPPLSEEEQEEEEQEEEEEEKAKLELWCDSCGSRVPPRSVSSLLAEDEEDRRLWEEAMVAMSDLEKAEEKEDEGKRRGSGPPGRIPLEIEGMPHRNSENMTQVLGSASSSDAVGFATSLALGRVLERVKWRDARLSPLSMRRAVAHDMHARILATREDFAGAADACARALHVLVRRFAPEDQELGVEFLKLAELCFNAGWMDKCGAACRKARVSLGVCLQPGDEQLATLDTLQGLCRR